MLQVSSEMQTNKKRKRVKGLAVENCHALFASENLDKLSDREKKSAFSDKDVLLIGYAGLAGAVQIAEKKQEELLSRYPMFFIEQTILQKALLKEIPEAATAMMSGECGVLALSKGGVYQGLWYIAELTGVGLEIECKKIPIKQETVEICNFFDINPYLLYADKAMLVVTDNGYRMKHKLQQLGVDAEIIGVTTKGPDKAVVNGEERRFLEKRVFDPLDELV
ncbi:MAG: hypothetical protein E7299_09010 [Lachnospiraceae bacterium]|nr:hypothetical protein [Lachnospiraceae bacterium]